MRLPGNSLIVLVGASGAGKSQWAARWFRSEQIVSSDALRATVGSGEHDQRASADAFELLELIVTRRLSRRLLTVVDTTGLEDERRARYVLLARRHGVPCHAVLFDTDPADVKKRNRQRSRPVPANVLSGQLTGFLRVQEAIRAEGFDGVHPAGDAEVVPEELVPAADAAGRQARQPRALEFGLQISSFAGASGNPQGLAARLEEVASVAEAVGFQSIWLMDHMLQIPQVGRPWEDIPESWTTLAWLAGRTRKVRLGTLVTAVTMRNPAHLAKIVATVDVLSGGRAVCGIGLAWWQHEHDLYGWPFPPVGDRYDLLEDALQLLPLMWGPGTPAFKGKVLEVPEAVCYPRPVQEHVPILVGGSGEKRTLALAARYADACNLFGDAAAVAHRVKVVREHCRRFGRDAEEIEVTHLSTALAEPSRRQLDAAVGRLAGPSETPEAAATRLGAGTVEDHVGRYRLLAEAGVQTAIVSLPDAWTPGGLENFGRVIDRFR
jgi:F420-dependent oxidoreductase-like protein